MADIFCLLLVIAIILSCNFTPANTCFSYKDISLIIFFGFISHYVNMANKLVICILIATGYPLAELI